MKRGGILVVDVVVELLHRSSIKKVEDIERCPGYKNVMCRSQAVSLTSMSSGSDVRRWTLS